MHHSAAGRLGGFLPYTGAVERGRMQNVRYSQGTGVSKGALRVAMCWKETHLIREAWLECGICFSPQDRGFGPL